MSTVSSYINNLSDNRKGLYLDIYNVIIKLHPSVITKINWGMPTFIINDKTVLALAEQKNYISLYILDTDILSKYKADLPKNTGKSCIRLSSIDNTLLNTITSIIKESITTALQPSTSLNS